MKLILFLKMRKSLIAVALLSTATSCFAFNIGAVYVGIDAGGSWRSQNLGADDAVQATVKSFTESNFKFGNVTGSLKPTLGLHVGYDIAMGNGFMGAIDVNVNTTFGNDSVTRFDGNAAGPTAAGATITWVADNPIKFFTSVKRTVGAALTPRVGYAVNPCLAVYGKFGIGMAVEKYKSGASVNAADTKWTPEQKRLIWTFTPGVGVRYKFTKNMAVRLEYGYEFTTSKEIEFLGSKLSVKSNSHQVTFGISYHF
jgi:opacity protein-like surface antigen